LCFRPGSSVAEEENDPPADNDEDDDDDDESDDDIDDDYDEERDEEMDQADTGRGDTAAEHMHQVHRDINHNQ